MTDFICSLIMRMKTRRRCHMVASHVFSVTSAGASCQSLPTLERLTGPFSTSTAPGSDRSTAWYDIRLFCPRATRWARTRAAALDLLGGRSSLTLCTARPTAVFITFAPQNYSQKPRGDDRETARCEGGRMCRWPRTVCANLRQSADWKSEQKRRMISVCLCVGGIEVFLIMRWYFRTFKYLLMSFGNFSNMRLITVFDSFISIWKL